MKTRTDDAQRPASAGGRPNGSTAGDRGRWMALVAALLGWMFDGFEIGAQFERGRERGLVR